jgi:hypothetical protein
MGVGMTRE